MDVFFNLRAPDLASFAGGVFIIVKCENKKYGTFRKQGPFGEP